MVDKVPSQILSGTPSDTSIVHASENGVLNRSRGHNERDMSRLQGTAPLYSAAKTYLINDLVTESGIVYRAIAVIPAPEPFNIAKWDAVGSGGLNTNLSNMTSPTVPPVDINMSTKAVTNSQKFELSASAAASIIGTQPSMSFLFASAELALNIPLNTGITVYENGIQGATKFTKLTISTRTVLAGEKLFISDNFIDPGSNGTFVTNGPDVKVMSGGIVRNLSDIGVATKLPLDATITNPGELSYNTTLQVMEVKGLDTTLQVGQEEHVAVVNRTGFTIPNGTVVRIAGYDAASDRLKIVLSLANVRQASNVIGVTTNEMLDNQEGKVTKSGRINDIDTTIFNLNDNVFLSDTIPGGLQNFPPLTFPIRIGHVGKIDASVGWIEIHVVVFPESIHAELSDDTTQTFVDNISKSLVFNTTDILSGIEHNNTLNPEEIVITNAGTYIVNLEPQILKTSGSSNANINFYFQKLAGASNQFPFSLQHQNATGLKLNINTQLSSPHGLTFSADGTKMFVCDFSPTIFQYTLTTPWDMDTASFDGVSLSIAATVSNTSGIQISPDGLRLFGTSTGDDNMWQFDLLTPNSIAGAFPAGLFSVTTEDGSPSDLVFSPDGEFVFITGDNNNAVFRYELGTAYDITTAVYSGNTLDVSSLVTSTLALEISADGKTLFVGGTGDVIYQFTLGNPFDLLSGFFSGASLNVNLQESNLLSIAFRPDGTSLFISGNVSGGFVTQFNMTTIAYHLRNTSVTGITIDTSTDFPDIFGLQFNDDGSKLFVASNPDDSIYEYILPVKFSLFDAVFSGNTVDLTEVDSLIDISFVVNGTILYALDFSSDFIRQYGLSTPYDLSTVSFSNKTFGVSSEEPSTRGIFFSPDGSKFWIIGNASIVFEYNMTTNFDLGTAVYSGNSVALTAITGTGVGIKISSDGHTLIGLGSGSGELVEYFLPTAYSLVGAVFTEYVFSIIPSAGSYQSFTFGKNGAKIIVCGLTNDEIIEFNVQSNFINIPNTNIRQGLTTQNQPFLVSNTRVIECNTGDTLRVMTQVSSDLLTLAPLAAFGVTPNDVPATPSVKLSLTKVG